MPKTTGNSRAVELSDVLDELAAQDDGYDTVEGISAGTTPATVKMKLNTFCSHPQLRAALRAVVLDVNELLGQAYAFANVHILRLLEDGLDIPKMDRNFFYRCLVAVSATASDKILSDDFKATAATFDAARPDGQAKVSINGLNQVVADLSITMATMASNHLVLDNLDRRIEKYAKWKRPDLKGHWKKIAIATTDPKANLDRLFPAVHGADERRTLRAQAARALAEELRAMLRFPTAARFATRAHLTLPLYYKILKETTSGPTETPGTATNPWFRPFTLLPMKNGFTVGYVPISKMMLMALVKRWEGFKGDGRLEDHAAIWRKYFNVNLVETASRRFDGRIATDGCGVSILMAKRSALQCHGAPDAIAYAKALRRGKARVCGVDPGFTDVVTVAASDGSVASYSSAKYYDRAGFNLSRRRTDKWNEETAAETAGVPTCKVATVGEMVHFVQAYLAVLRPLLEHRAARGYRNMRFLRYVRSNQAIEEICDLVAPPGKETIVGFGDWSGGFKSPVSRRTCGPIEQIKHRLKQRTPLLDVPERKTSVTCSGCQARLRNMVADTTTLCHQTGLRTTRRNKVHVVLHCRRSADRGDASHCGQTWNRDVNASKNILRITFALLAGRGVPGVFAR